jgi:hypothetical protein
MISSFNKYRKIKPTKDVYVCNMMIDITGKGGYITTSCVQVNPRNEHSTK